MATVLRKIQLYADLVKFEHTVFALPFALAALLLAAGPGWPPLATVLWVVLAMVGGRTYAMGLNRLIDHRIDGLNPRTQNRALPAGRVQAPEAWALTLLSLGLMVWATLQLPPLCLQLLPLAIGVLSIYSYVKRFSSLAHLVLGFALGASAIGGWVALTGTLSWPAVCFGLAVMFWVAGFDIIYACQDIDFDRAHGLWSIPARLGTGNSLRLSRVFHLLTVLLLALVGWMLPETGLFYSLAVLMVGGMLLYEHRLVSADDLSRVNEAFFNINGAISVGVFLLVLLDKWL